jgi:uncharacterized membrane protein
MSWFKGANIKSSHVWASSRANLMQLHCEIVSGFIIIGHFVGKILVEHTYICTQGNDNTIVSLSLGKRSKKLNWFISLHVVCTIYAKDVSSISLDTYS